MNINQKLSQHFSLRECIKSEIAARFNLSNMPPEEYILKLKFLCENILEPIRAFYGIPFSPNSMYRTEEVNTFIGGSETSQHVQAEAVDIELPGIDNFNLATWIKNHLEYDQLILECYKPGIKNSGWVHISLKNNNNRYQALTYDGKQYFPGLVE